MQDRGQTTPGGSWKYVEIDANLTMLGYRPLSVTKAFKTE